ncbi:uncharacterized protein V3H82_017489 isoform 2-T2 [Fundulus diaphanus]
MITVGLIFEDLKTRSAKLLVQKLLHVHQVGVADDLQILLVQTTKAAKVVQTPAFNEGFLRALLADMESVGEESGRKRKRKFEAIELKVLVEEANTHIGELRQKQLCLSRRNAIWDSICAKVNAVGKTKRSADEVKRRWQDFRRRTREELSRKKSLAQKQRSQKGSPDFPETLCEGQVLGIEGYDFLRPNTINQDVQQAPPHSSDLLTSVKVPEEPRRSPVTDDIYQELLYQQIHQTDALETIAQEVRAVSSVARAVRGQTRAILAHTRQLVGALSGLTMAINALASAGRSSGVSGPSTVLAENEEEGGEDTGGHQSGLRKRKAPNKNSDLETTMETA